MTTRFEDDNPDGERNAFVEVSDQVMADAQKRAVEADTGMRDALIESIRAVMAGDFYEDAE